MTADGPSASTASTRSRTSTLLDAVQASLWPLPVLFVVVAIGLGVGVPRLDESVDSALPAAVSGYLFGGDADAARSLLSAIAGSLITVTSLTFSLTVVTLQLASSQFSPRLLRTFVRDRVVHVTLGLFLATFTYALTALRTVRSSDESQDPFVPQIAVTLSYLLAIASVLTLVLFLAHIARQIRIETVLESVHGETTATLERVLPERDPGTGPRTAPRAPSDARPVLARRSGFVTSVDEAELVEAASGAGAVVQLDRRLGDSVVAGTPVATWWPTAGSGSGDAQDAVAEAVGDAVAVGAERTAAQDPEYGLRQLVDVTCKALSPGINDPTTGIHALGHVSAVLCEMVPRDLGPRLLEDGDGELRVVLPRADLGELLELAIGQPRRYGAADPEVLSRIVQLLREVAWVCDRPDQREAVAVQLHRLRQTIGQQDFDDAELGRFDRLTGTVEDALAGRWQAGAS